MVVHPFIKQRDFRCYKESRKKNFVSGRSTKRVVDNMFDMSKYNKSYLEFYVLYFDSQNLSDLNKNKDNSGFLRNEIACNL